MANSISLVQPQFSPVSLTLPAEMSWGEWEETGQALQAIERSFPWWMGDWLNYGEHRWGETYTQAIEVTGHNLDRLQNYKWVANRVAPADRNQNLSWTHHRYVAKLLPAGQRHWLGIAEEEGWSSAQLMSALRAADALPAMVDTNTQSVGMVYTPAQWRRIDDDRVLLTQDRQSVMLSNSEIENLWSWFRGKA